MNERDLSYSLPSSDVGVGWPEAVALERAVGAAVWCTLLDSQGAHSPDSTAPKVLPCLTPCLRCNLNKKTFRYFFFWQHWQEKFAQGRHNKATLPEIYRLLSDR